MIQDTIAKIEEALKTSTSIKDEKRTELLNLVDSLKSEMETLAKTNSEDAETVAGFAGISTQMATRQEKKPALLEVSLEGLTKSVEEFEGSHPRLVEVVNRISTALANMGI